MATTLNALVMRVSAETDQLEQSMRDVRRDVNRVNQTFREMKSETDKVEEQIAALVRRFKAGKISAEQYQKGMAHLADKHRQARISAGGFGGQMAKLGSLMTPQTAALAGLALAVGAATAAYRTLSSAVRNALATMQELDPVIKSSRSINALVGDVQSLSFALGEVAGMTEERTTKALQNLARIVGQAKLEGGTAAKAFQTLGLSVEQMAAMSPTDQFHAVASALQGIESASERARISQQLFGREGRDIVNGLMAEQQSLEAAEQAARDFGLTLSQPQATAIEAANDATGRLSSQFEGIQRQFAAGLAPAIKVFSDELSAILPKGGTLTGMMDALGASVAYAVGMAVDFGNALLGAAKILTGSFSEGKALIEGALSLETAERFGKKYLEAKEAARQAANEDKDRAAAQEAIARQAKQVQDSYDQQVLSLENEIALMGKSEEAARRIQLQQKQYTDEQIKFIMAKEQELKLLKETEAENEKRAKAMEDLRARGLKMMEDNSPIKMVEKQLADLNVLLKVGAINEATFFKERNKILAEQVKDIAGAGPAESVQAGSAKAAEMLQQRMADEQNEQVAKLEEVRLQNELQTNVQRETNRLLKELRPVGTLR